MSARVALRLLSLYPLAFQRRYGEEMRALLEQQPPGPREVADILLGAVRAHLRPPASTAGAIGPGDRARLSSSALLICWVLFAAAGLGYYKTTEDYPFSLAGDRHPLLREAHLVVQAAAVIGSLAVLLGAAPLIGIALSRARTELGVRRRVLGAVAPVAGFAGATVVVAALLRTSPPHTSSAIRVGAVIWLIAGLVCGLACAGGCRAALFAIPVRGRWLNWALTSGGLAALAMVIIAAATGVYAVALLLAAPALAASGNGPLQSPNTGVWLIGLTAVMATLSALAAVTLRRGWPARRHLDDVPASGRT